MIRAQRRWHRRIWWTLAPVVLVLFLLALWWRPEQPDEGHRFPAEDPVGVQP